MNDNTTLHARLLTLQDEMEKKAGALDFFVKNKAIANAIRNIASGFGKVTENGLKGALGLGYWARKPLFWGGTIGATGLGAYAYGKGYTPGDVIDKGRGALIRGLGGQYESKGGNGAGGAAAGGAAGGTAKADAAAKAQAAKDALERREVFKKLNGWTDAQYDFYENVAKHGDAASAAMDMTTKFNMKKNRILARQGINGTQLGTLENRANNAYINSLYSDPGSSSGRPTGRPGY